MATEAARALEAILMVAEEPVEPGILAQLLELSVERAQLTISDRRPALQDLPPRPLAAVASL